MAGTVTIDLRHVARGLNVPLQQVQAVVELLDDGNTVPFITRYRKDGTGGLDEEQIRQIQARLAKVRQLADRKETILRSIESQGKLTDELTKHIRSASTTKRLEDLYLPYKPKKQTLATMARSRGLEPLAREILEADPACSDLDARAADFVSTDRQIPTAADALLGAGHILAEQFSERADLRQKLRDVFQRTGKFVCTGIGEIGKPVDKAKEAKSTKDSEKAEKPAEAAKTPAKEPPEESQNTSQDESPPARQTETSEDRSEASKKEPNNENPANPGNENPGNPGTENPASPGNDDSTNPDDENPSCPDNESHADPPAGSSAESSEELTASSEKPAEAAAVPDKKPVEIEAEPAAAAEVRPAAATKPKPPRRPKLTKRELKKKKTEEKKIKAFQDYFDYTEEIKKIPHHRVLAINRGERAKVLRVRTEADLEAMYAALDEVIPEEHPHAEYLRGCARDALTRLILPSLEREIRRELTDRAEVHAVEVFARNLRNLLLQPPIHDRRVLAVDPGFKSGCKLAALDQFGNVLAHDVIYLVGKTERRESARQKVVELVDGFQLTVVVIGKGTACRETEDFFAELLAGELKGRDVAYVIVNEAGASVYSTSRTGREEFPHYDATLRGAISIGRRLQDPLSELVKIDPANIGVGLYQHDVKAKHLRSSLDDVVESCVNYVGVDVNTASPALLRYVSGLNQLTARRVHEHRREHGPFRNRQQLREVPGFGEATFVQAAGFLKIKNGDMPLDATWIHPESYETTTRVLEKLGFAPADLANKEKSAGLAEQAGKVDAEKLAVELQVGTLLLGDILGQLARPGRDPREGLPAPVFKQGVLKLEDLNSGMELTGTVLNVVDFGCFVDIGMHDSGLVHVSQLADKFVRDPHEVVAVGDIVKVWVVDVDRQRRRVSLTMIKPGSERPRRGRRGKTEGKTADTEKAKQQDKGRRQRPKQRAKERRDRPARGKTAAGRKGPPKGYQTRHRAKPVTPISDAMKTGDEPMRTFGHLMQFYQEKEQNAEEKQDETKSEIKQDETKSETKPDKPKNETKPDETKSETKPDEAAGEVKPDDTKND